MPLSNRRAAIALLSLILALSVALPLPQKGLIAGVAPFCPFHGLTGLPCPGCGLTRAFVCCGHGQFGEALRWHALGPLLFLAVLIGLFGLLRKWDFSARCRRLGGAALGGLLLLCWASRLSGFWPLPGP